MKRASEHPFPYGWPGQVCYFHIVAGLFVIDAPSLLADAIGVTLEDGAA